MAYSRRSLLVAVLTTMAGLASAQVADGERLTLILFDDRPDSDAVKLQRAMLASPKFGRLGFDLLEALGREPVRFNRVVQPAPTAAELRRDYRVGEGFAIRVVDHEGVVLLATRQPVTIDDLEALVAQRQAP